MASFSSWQGAKMHGHKGLLTDVLKGRMDFQGFVVGDWNAHGQVDGLHERQLPAVDQRRPRHVHGAGQLARSVRQPARAGASRRRFRMARLDDAVARILRVKLRMGLFEAGPPSKRPLRRQVRAARRARASRGRAPGRARIARAAEERRTTCCRSSRSATHPRRGRRRRQHRQAIRRLDARRGRARASTTRSSPAARRSGRRVQRRRDGAGGSAELAVDGKYSTKPDAAIVVFGENPYAEFQGDLSVPDAARRRRSAPRADAAPARAEHSGRRGVPVRPSAVDESRAERCERIRRGVAAGLRRRRHRRRAVRQARRLRRPRLQGPALVRVAAPGDLLREGRLEGTAALPSRLRSQLRGQGELAAAAGRSG